MKKIINGTVSEYTVQVNGRPYRVQPQSYLVCEDEVAKEFMKYYPTVLKVEDVIIPKVQEVKIEEKIEQPTEKIDDKPKVAEKETKKISTEVPKKRGRPAKSKK